MDIKKVKDILERELSYYSENTYEIVIKENDGIIYKFSIQTRNKNNKILGGYYDTIPVEHHITIKESSLSDIIHEYINSGKIIISTQKNYQRINTLLIEYAPLAELSDIDKRFIKGFEQYLILKGNKPNTIIKNIKILKRLIRIAQSKGYINYSTEELFSEIITKKEETHKETLSNVEIIKLEKYLVENFNELTDAKKEVLASFLFSCYTGVRFSDIILLTYDNIKMIKNKRWLFFKMQKTSRNVYIPLEQIFNGHALKVMRLFKRTRGLIFRLPSNAKTNRILKQIYKDILKGEKNISFHTARHTAATLLLYHKIPLTTIQGILGHTHITTTEIYADLNAVTMYNSLRGVKFKDF